MEHNEHSVDQLLVLFSYLIAVVSSYNVLTLAGTLNRSKGANRAWLVYGAIVLGLGVWSMHFVGTMAGSTHLTVTYDLTLILASVVVGIGASFVTLYLVANESLSRTRLYLGASIIAAGIASMHYMGMEAMDVDIYYNWVYVVLSVLVAFLASVAALWLSFYFVKHPKYTKSWYYKKLAGALVMGAAISGMHYIGMLGSEYDMNPIHMDQSGVLLDQIWLGYLIAGGAMLTLGLSMIGLYVSRRFSHQEMEKQEQERWYKSLYDNNQDGVISVNLNHHIIGFNPAVERITGVAEEELKNRHIEEILPIFHPGEQERVREMYKKSVAGEKLSYESVIYNRSGSRVDLNMVHVPVIIEGKVTGHYIIVRDVTNEKQVRERNQFLAFHDDLTGLPNRRLINNVLADLIDRENSESQPFALMVMDLDRFKIINDSLGHLYGDLLLKEISKRIVHHTTDKNVVIGRIGGDEFSILLLDYTHESDAAELAERLMAVISEPYDMKGNNYYVSTSIGIAVYSVHGRDAIQLMKNADTAMYEVKKNGKNGYRFFSCELNAQVEQRVELEADLRRALERGEFLLHYQPQIRADDESIIGVEALVRWNHPTKGILPPGLFVPVAEDTGLIMELESRVLYEACRQMQSWHESGAPLISVAVNLSSHQFYHSSLTQQIKDVIEQTGLEAKYLELEITESLMMNPEVSSGVLKELANLGIRISLDDFGTGYSSLSYLKKLPINKLKIDRTFIQDIAHNDNDKAIVASIIDMAHHLNLNVIAEGIETKDQLEILSQHNCREVQGYYFSRPLPASELERVYLHP
ncbi:bifunctional diguanylate cyclase/phosphodiesterase [Paenibacillus urinalis]|uniref:EAL domain-containing protein n=1 Tax=Paenibacillus urinalis TaxID=521520 RepID=A0AAX3MZ23_9BACL|nr:bifunctional diguanylate cyclase/phosphodiesterase [Paenibacillus urinalis]WDH82366.1 EAL domain-containing protein [Paenibacillus urinalis]